MGVSKGQKDAPLTEDLFLYDEKAGVFLATQRRSFEKLTWSDNSRLFLGTKCFSPLPGLLILIRLALTQHSGSLEPDTLCQPPD